MLKLLHQGGCAIRRGGGLRLWIVAKRANISSANPGPGIERRRRRLEGGKRSPHTKNMQQVQLCVGPIGLDCLFVMMIDELTASGPARQQLYNNYEENIRRPRSLWHSMSRFVPLRDPSSSSGSQVITKCAIEKELVVNLAAETWQVSDPACSLNVMHFRSLGLFARKLSIARGCGQHKHWLLAAFV